MRFCDRQAQEDIDGHRAAGVVRDRDTAKARKAASDAAAAEEQRTALAHEAALEAQQVSLLYLN